MATAIEIAQTAVAFINSLVQDTRNRARAVIDMIVGGESIKAADQTKAMKDAGLSATAWCETIEMAAQRKAWVDDIKAADGMQSEVDAAREKWSRSLHQIETVKAENEQRLKAAFSAHDANASVHRSLEHRQKQLRQTALDGLKRTADPAIHTEIATLSQQLDHDRSRLEELKRHLFEVCREYGHTRGSEGYEKFLQTSQQARGLKCQIDKIEKNLPPAEQRLRELQAALLDPLNYAIDFPE